MPLSQCLLTSTTHSDRCVMHSNVIFLGRGQVCQFVALTKAQIPVKIIMFWWGQRFGTWRCGWIWHFSSCCDIYVAITACISHTIMYMYVWFVVCFNVHVCSMYESVENFKVYMLNVYVMFAGDERRRTNSWSKCSACYQRAYSGSAGLRPRQVRR